MKINNLKLFTRGIISENPVFVLMLGTCPSLAVTTTAFAALGMGISVTVVLVFSNGLISLLRKIIPDPVRIPAFITVVAAFVAGIQMLIKAFLPAIEDSLGIYLALIAVNCIILGRAELFARKNKVLPSVIDGLGMGIGFALALLALGIIREILGSGSLFGFTLIKSYTPIGVFAHPAGGFFVYGLLIALANRIFKGSERKKALPSCAVCPLQTNCAQCKLEGGDEDV